MGFMVRDKCFAQWSDASNYYFSTFPEHQQAEGAGFLRVSHFFDGVQWMRQTTHFDAQGVAQSQQSSVVSPVQGVSGCDPSGAFLDGMTIGWMVAVALVAASAIKMMRKGI